MYILINFKSIDIIHKCIDICHLFDDSINVKHTWDNKELNG